MSFYDFFFPDQAQASHLRSIAGSQLQQNIQASTARARQARSTQSANQRVEELEDELENGNFISLNPN